jgi:hypothetical protein
MFGSRISSSSISHDSENILEIINQQYLEYLRMQVEMVNCNGILLNIREDLQPTALEALRDEQL